MALQLTRIRAFLHACADRGVERLLIEELAEEAPLKSVVRERPVGTLAGPLDKLKERIVLVVSDAVALGVEPSWTKLKDIRRQLTTGGEPKTANATPTATAPAP